METGPFGALLRVAERLGVELCADCRYTSGEVALATQQRPGYVAGLGADTDGEQVPLCGRCADAADHQFRREQVEARIDDLRCELASLDRAPPP